MKRKLDRVEARLLGALMEKEATTPDYYPLSLNSLRTACNQKTNRSPVMQLEETAVMDSLDQLIKCFWVVRRNTSDSRVPKFAHRLERVFQFSPKQQAVICVLLLRGPQTAGEIRLHTQRMVDFADIAEVNDVLQELSSWSDGPLVVRLQRQPGSREHRFAHLLCGDVQDVEQQVVNGNTQANSPSEERIANLEAQIMALRAELNEIRQYLV